MFKMMMMMLLRSLFLSSSIFGLFLQSAHGASLRGGGAASSSTAVSPVEHRELSGVQTIFPALSCNDNIAASTCVTWSSQSFDANAGPVTIPCGTCVTMDADASSPLILPNGLNIEGKLVFPDGYQIEIHTPYIFVQGELEMTSTSPTSGNENIKIVMTGNDPISLVPHTDNASLCPDGGVGCSFGTKPIAIAGGKLNIQGLPDSCPTWVNLKNVVTSMPNFDDLPTYIPPAPGCSDVLVETHFTGGDRGGWYRNYGGTDSEQTTNSHTPNDSYWLFGGRTSSWNGPQINLDASCFVPDVTYFISAKARLTKPGGISNCQLTGSNCLKLTSFMEDTDRGKSWNNRGVGPQVNDGEWFDFISTTKFRDRFDDVETAIARRLFWEGPEAGVEIALDDIRVFRLPETSFVDPQAGASDVCSELLVNGDAEDTTLHPFTYPWSKTEGASRLSLGTEDDGNGGVNHYYSLTQRHYGWSSPSQYLQPECIEVGVVYEISVDIRVHSTEKKKFRRQLTITKPDGTHSWPWLGTCPPQDINDGWVTCTGTYQFDEKEATATALKLYLVSDDSTHDDIDVDNFSVTFQSGPVQALVVDDPTGDLASCWGSGSELLVTSNNLDFDDVSTPTVASAQANGDSTTTIHLVEPIEMTSYADNEPDAAVEVALLSRNIVFESEDTDYDKGGHLIVFKTDRDQALDGAEFKRFGQQGTLGRYPVHFHLSGAAVNSKVSRNTVRDSNQRCYVAHGTHDITWEENIGYNTFGHCFMLEDHSERRNLFVKNLAAVTKKVITKIRDEETDDFPASYWITNPENIFLNNVAAGSEHSGFWFEMKNFIRGGSANLPENAGYKPMEAPLTLFQGNIAHSNDEHGIKTYPGSGYKPKGAPAVFLDSKSYRNAGNGVFIHNSENIKIQGGQFADNRVQIDIDRSPTCIIDGALIRGYSSEFRSIKERTYSRGHCPSGWPIRGVEIHTFWVGGTQNTGTKILNTAFEDFGNTGCADSTAIRIDEEDRGYFDVRTEISNTTFDSETAPISGCDAIEHALDDSVADGISHRGVDNFIIHDSDGSIIGQPGFIVANTPRMTTFGNCVPDALSCTATCVGQCFRAMIFAVSSLEPDSLLLEVTDTDTGVSLSIEGHYEWSFKSDGSLNTAENTKSYRSRMFFAVLPSGGNYSARFVKDGQTYWPVYVKKGYDDPGSSCPEFNSFDLVEPPATCNELIKNGDMEAGTDDWVASQGGLVSVDESASGQGMALTSEYRTSYWMGPAQYLDTRCMTVGTNYVFTAKAKLVSKSTGAAIDCDPAADMCPKVIVKLESGPHEEYDEYWHRIGSASSWDPSGWNDIQGSFTVSAHIADAESVLAYWESNTLNGGDALIVIDDVSIQPVA